MLVSKEGDSAPKWERCGKIGVSKRQQKTETKQRRVVKSANFRVKKRTRCRRNVSDVDVTMLKSRLGGLVKNGRGSGETVGVLGRRK